MGMKCYHLTLLLPERPKLYTILAFLSVIGLTKKELHVPTSITYFKNIYYKSLLHGTSRTFVLWRKEDYRKIPSTKTVVHLEGGFIKDMTNTVCGIYVM